MTILITIGGYGGWYCYGGRICLGWVAITFFPFDIDPLLDAMTEHGQGGRDG